jgi:integrase
LPIIGEMGPRAFKTRFTTTAHFAHTQPSFPGVMQMSADIVDINARRIQHRPGEIWLHRYDHTPSYYAAWYDPEGGQTRHKSLNTTDDTQARIELAKLIVERSGLSPDAPAEVTLSFVLYWYYERHAQFIPSARAARDACNFWLAFFGDVLVCELTPMRLREFCAWLMHLGYGPGTQNRILATGRAALYLASENGYLATVPRIPYTERRQDMFTKNPKGRPLSDQELGAVFDAIASDHIFVISEVLANTMARPTAAMELRYGRFPSVGGIDRQIDFEHGLIHLNAPGRTQTRKRRPTVKMTQTLRWMLDTNGCGHLVHYHGKPVKDVGGAFRKLRAAASLYLYDDNGQTVKAMDSDTGEMVPVGDPMVNPYSLRHTMARALRKQNVDAEQIELFLGHRDPTGNPLTEIYAPYDPAYCADAVRGIDLFLYDVQKHCRRQIVPSDLMSHYARFEATEALGKLNKILHGIRSAGGEIDRSIIELSEAMNRVTRNI